MDRPEPGLIKWSPNASHDSFLHLNLQHRVVQLYRPTGHAQHGRFDYDKISKHDEVPPLTTYDWSPSAQGLVAVGTSTGIVNLLRVDDGSNDYKELIPKVARTCLAVAFNTTGLLAVGLDRVRNDPCLHIWDVNRLSTIHDTGPGFPSGALIARDPWKRLEHNASISSIKFFEDNPHTLVVGMKGSGLRIHDLREGYDSVINFQTKCNNNLAIDYADQNYFASSALDSPVVMVWDRRALSRTVASLAYLEAVDVDNMPLGGALCLSQAMELERDPQARSSRSSLIRKLGYCRDQRGMLAVLSRTGQLKVFSTQQAGHAPGNTELESPQLLQVRRSYEMDNFYTDTDRKNERIVSFDWVTSPSPWLGPRLLVLRNNGALEILEAPCVTRMYPYKLTPWQAPYRDLADGDSYHNILSLESNQAKDTLGPFVLENFLSNLPIFGPDRASVAAMADRARGDFTADHGRLEDEMASSVPLPETFTSASTISEKLKALRGYKWGITNPDLAEKEDLTLYGPMTLIKLQEGLPEESSNVASRSLHESLLRSTMETAGFPRAAQLVLDHTMLSRAKEKYLFDCRVNRTVVDDDPWLKDVWGWIEDAEEACLDGGMLAHPLDLGFLGVQAIWTEYLGKEESLLAFLMEYTLIDESCAGERPTLRLAEGSGPPDGATWARCISAICKRRDLPEFDGIATKKPHHRQLLLDVCGWGADTAIEDALMDGEVDYKNAEGGASWYTKMTALALFRDDAQKAIRILKEGSKAHPKLLFVSLALQLVSRADRSEAAEQLDFDEVIAAKTDPYLRAISSFIATGDWAAIATQRSLPLRDRTFVAVRNFDDDQLTEWLAAEVQEAIEEGDIEGIVLTGITDKTVDILATYVSKFHDVQTATLIMSFCAPRYIDDHRCTAWRNAYRAYLQRHKAFYQRTKFEVESTKRSKRDGRPTIKPPSRQIALRCVYCDAETSLLQTSAASSSANIVSHGPAAGSIPGPFHANGRSSHSHNNPSYSEKMAAPGITCPKCNRHLPRCVVCLEVVGVPRSDMPSTAADPDATKLALRFPTFCLKCEHVLHLDHARQWFARHNECPVPECRCRCNFRANPEIN
ncbi:hypothetical protein M406DRAFT_246127 [Cryphonectria parasitica EP155]|uniref:Uncharacterized protein n=1 Tax=Cryphonectria parasitica (strain ATCC 38755 / EP155) TaxID=660469 RepID=A0A9P4YAM5_CRYP1|nr:uncharacterized protein M406DRAFT_246127 [Cryphonectria parasitica EP155]KAF3769858.1 hypothetical protein M406DRAFT_246127 [Cryphonectria parasitica EP155]